MAGVPSRGHAEAGMRSRSDLMQARKRAQVPDASYDFDGDGVVSNLDHFIGRSFDKNRSGRLSPAAHQMAKDALSNGWLDSYARGFDSQGDKGRPYAIQQKGGVILTADNVAEASQLIHAPHHNASKVPRYATRTEMELARRVEGREHGEFLGDRYAKRMAFVPEPPPPTELSHPRTCPVTSIRQLAEGDHQAQRVRAGLLPMSTPVNPERELKAGGLSYAAEPMFATRSQLLETRKECMKQEAEDLAVKAEGAMTPRSVRASEKEASFYDFRRPGPDPMTLTKLKDERRQARREYDMAHFSLGRMEYPRFSDNVDVPFWAQGRPEGVAPAESRRLQMSVSEPAFKVTQVPFGDDFVPLPQDQAAGLAYPVDSPKGSNQVGTLKKYDIGTKTKKRFSREYAEVGEGRNKPRLFDALAPVEVNVRDMEPLDAQSSMEIIRNSALRDMKERRRKNAESPMRSKMCGRRGAALRIPAAAERLHGESSANGPAGASTEPRRVGAKFTLDGMVGDATRPRPAQARAVQTVYLGGADSQAVEPRTYGDTAAAAATNSAAMVGIRSGGFQSFDRTRSLGSLATRRGGGGGGGAAAQGSQQLLADSASALVLPLQY